MTIVIILANNILTFLIYSNSYFSLKSCNSSNCNSYSLDNFRENLTSNVYRYEKIHNYLINRMINDHQIKGQYEEID